MTAVSEQMLKKRWYCYLKCFLDEEMLDDISKEFGDEMDEAVAKLLYVVEFCQREEVVLTPEIATGVLFAILVECVSFGTYPDMDDVAEFGTLLAKDTGFHFC